MATEIRSISLRSFLPATLLVACAVIPALADHVPDGILDKPGYTLRLYRSSTTFTTTAGDLDGPDFSCGSVGISIPFAPRLMFDATYIGENRIQISHEVNAGFRLRFRDSHELDSAKLNADGPVGSPYVTALAGFRLYEGSVDTRYGVWSVGLGMPFSPYATLATTAKRTTDNSRPAVDDFSASLTIYSQKFSIRDAYANPDGPEGSLNLRALGGAASDGSFVEFNPFFVMNRTTVVSAVLRWETSDQPQSKVTIFGAQLSVYPGGASRVLTSE